MKNNDIDELDLRDEEKIPVNLKRIKGGRSPDLVMQPDDRLYVPVSPF